MSNEALNLIESSASDRPALETRWKWNEFATSCKRWAQERKTGAPSGIYENPEEEEAETSEEPSERLSSRKINVDSDDEEEEMVRIQSCLYSHRKLSLILDFNHFFDRLLKNRIDLRRTMSRKGAILTPSDTRFQIYRAIQSRKKKLQLESKISKRKKK